MAEITNESQIIDYETIKKICLEIKNIAKDFEMSAKHIKKSSDMCTSKVLSVEGLTFQPTLNELSELIKSIQTKIEEFVDNIDKLSLQVQTNQKSKLEEYKKEQKRQKKSNKNN